MITRIIANGRIVIAAVLANRSNLFSEWQYNNNNINKSNSNNNSRNCVSAEKHLLI